METLCTRRQNIWIKIEIYMHAYFSMAPYCVLKEYDNNYVALCTTLNSRPGYAKLHLGTAFTALFPHGYRKWLSGTVCYIILPLNCVLFNSQSITIELRLRGCEQYYVVRVEKWMSFITAWNFAEKNRLKLQPHKYVVFILIYISSSKYNYTSLRNVNKLVY